MRVLLIDFCLIGHFLLISAMRLFKNFKAVTELQCMATAKISFSKRFVLLVLFSIHLKRSEKFMQLQQFGFLQKKFSIVQVNHDHVSPHQKILHAFRIGRSGRETNSHHNRGRKMHDGLTTHETS